MRNGICCLKKCVMRDGRSGRPGCAGFLCADAGGTIPGRHRIETGVELGGMMMFNIAGNGSGGTTMEKCTATLVS